MLSGLLNNGCREHEMIKKNFYRNPQWKLQIGITQHRSNNTIKIGLREVGFEDLKWLKLPQKWSKGCVF